MEHCFSPNSGEDQKKKYTGKLLGKIYSPIPPLVSAPLTTCTGVSVKNAGILYILSSFVILPKRTQQNRIYAKKKLRKFLERIAWNQKLNEM